MITPGDIDDREPLKYNAFVEFLYGKLVGDKGYIGKELFQRLFVNGIQLITKLKSNMKGALMSVSDKLLLRKRAIIETVNDELKNIAQIGRTALYMESHRRKMSKVRRKDEGRRNTTYILVTVSIGQNYNSINCL